MHSIERYGIIALTLLVVTIMAVLMWDSDEVNAKSDPATQVAALPGGSAVGPVESPPRTTPESPPRTRDDAPVATASIRPRPLRRDLEPLVDPGAGAPAPAGAGLRQGRRASGTEEATSRDSREPETRPGRREQAAVGGRGEQDVTHPLLRPKPRIYVVATGDTLSEISQRELGTSKRWPEIVDANPGLDPARLKVGARLEIPVEAAAPRVADRAESAPIESSAAATDRYRVQNGDSLWKIAHRMLGDGERWREIAELNPNVDAAKIRVGQHLRLPLGARPVAASTPAPVVAQSAPTQKRGRVR